MVRVDFQPPVTKKQDTPALPPSPTALPDLPMIEREQVKIAPTPPMTRIVPKMRQAIPPVLTYGDLPTAAKTIVHSTITAPSKAKTPRESPVLPRPLKPPDYQRTERGYDLTDRDTIQASRLTSPQRTTLEGEKLQQTFHQKTETPPQQQHQPIPHPDFQPTPDSTTLWEQMREYHSSSHKWQFNNKQIRTDDGSPLIWTMVHPTSATWNRTYAWNQPLDEYTPWIACQTLPSKPVLLSYAMWTSRPTADTPIRTTPATRALTQPAPQKLLQPAQRTRPPLHHSQHPIHLPNTPYTCQGIA